MRFRLLLLNPADIGAKGGEFFDNAFVGHRAPVAMVLYFFGAVVLAVGGLSMLALSRKKKKLAAQGIHVHG